MRAAFVFFEQVLKMLPRERPGRHPFLRFLAAALGVGTTHALAVVATVTKTASFNERYELLAVMSPQVTVIGLVSLFVIWASLGWIISASTPAESSYMGLLRRGVFVALAMWGLFAIFFGAT